ncbi:hypothetical protein ADUPG1_000095 [Aduncisulcus paluster]|uniref:SEC7 domain-containing protein n=1 Tax=Aduncisulcus paluster TaxID=2918883 RepID=A0ABQ5K4S5_9EUKA|nr:hypothetical protein ADUPG1_000095 [Aduncisulcus paluster]
MGKEAPFLNNSISALQKEVKAKKDIELQLSLDISKKRMRKLKGSDIFSIEDPSTYYFPFKVACLCRKPKLMSIAISAFEKLITYRLLDDKGLIDEYPLSDSEETRLNKSCGRDNLLERALRTHPSATSLLQDALHTICDCVPLCSEEDYQHIIILLQDTFRNTNDLHGPLLSGVLGSLHHMYINGNSLTSNLVLSFLKDITHRIIVCYENDVYMERISLRRRQSGLKSRKSRSTSVSGPSIPIDIDISSPPDVIYHQDVILVLKTLIKWCQRDVSTNSVVTTTKTSFYLGLTLLSHLLATFGPQCHSNHEIKAHVITSVLPLSLFFHAPSHLPTLFVQFSLFEIVTHLYISETFVHACLFLDLVILPICRSSAASLNIRFMAFEMLGRLLGVAPSIIGWIRDGERVIPHASRIQSHREQMLRIADEWKIARDKAHSIDSEDSSIDGKSAPYFSPIFSSPSLLSYTMSSLSSHNQLPPGMDVEYVSRSMESVRAFYHFDTGEQDDEELEEDEEEGKTPLLPTPKPLSIMDLSLPCLSPWCLLHPSLPPFDPSFSMPISFYVLSDCNTGMGHLWASIVESVLDVLRVGLPSLSNTTPGSSSGSASSSELASFSSLASLSTDPVNALCRCESVFGYKPSGSDRSKSSPGVGVDGENGSTTPSSFPSLPVSASSSISMPTSPQPPVPLAGILYESVVRNKERERTEDDETKDESVAPEKDRISCSLSSHPFLRISPAPCLSALCVYIFTGLLDSLKDWERRAEDAYEKKVASGSSMSVHEEDSLFSIPITTKEKEGKDLELKPEVKVKFGDQDHTGDLAFLTPLPSFSSLITSPPLQSKSATRKSTKTVEAIHPTPGSSETPEKTVSKDDTHLLSYPSSFLKLSATKKQWGQIFRLFNGQSSSKREQATDLLKLLLKDKVTEMEKAEQERRATAPEKEGEIEYPSDEMFNHICVERLIAQLLLTCVGIDHQDTPAISSGTTPVSPTSSAPLTFFAPSAIGTYLADRNNTLCMKHYIELSSHDWKMLSPEAAMRKFLSKFRMHGETQSQDRVIQAFAAEYSRPCKLFPDPVLNDYDTAYGLFFSMIMLHGDIYSPVSTTRKMTREQYIRNTKGIDYSGRGDLTDDLLGEIFDSITKHPFGGDAVLNGTEWKKVGDDGIKGEESSEESDDISVSDEEKRYASSPLPLPLSSLFSVSLPSLSGAAFSHSFRKIFKEDAEKDIMWHCMWKSHEIARRCIRVTREQQKEEREREKEERRKKREGHPESPHVISPLSPISSSFLAFSYHRIPSHLFHISLPLFLSLLSPQSISSMSHIHRIHACSSSKPKNRPTGRFGIKYSKKDGNLNHACEYTSSFPSSDSTEGSSSSTELSTPSSLVTPLYICEGVNAYFSIALSLSQTRLNSAVIMDNQSPKDPHEEEEEEEIDEVNLDTETQALSPSPKSSITLSEKHKPRDSVVSSFVPLSSTLKCVIYEWVRMCGLSMSKEKRSGVSMSLEELARNENGRNLRISDIENCKNSSLSLSALFCSLPLSLSLPPPSSLPPLSFSLFSNILPLHAYSLSSLCECLCLNSTAECTKEVWESILALVSVCDRIKSSRFDSSKSESQESSMTGSFSHSHTQLLEYNQQILCEFLPSSTVDGLFFSSASLSPSSLFFFMSALICVSNIEIAEKTKATSLQRIVDTTCFNFNNREEDVFRRLWEDVSFHFISTATSSSMALSLYSIDVMRQLLKRYMMECQSAWAKGRSYQTIFIKPLSTIASRVSHTPSLSHVLECIDECVTLFSEVLVPQAWEELLQCIVLCLTNVQSCTALTELEMNSVIEETQRERERESHSNASMAKHQQMQQEAIVAEAKAKVKKARESQHIISRHSCLIIHKFVTSALHLCSFSLPSILNVLRLLQRQRVVEEVSVSAVEMIGTVVGFFVKMGISHEEVERRDPKKQKEMEKKTEDTNEAKEERGDEGEEKGDDSESKKKESQSSLFSLTVFPSLLHLSDSVGLDEKRQCVRRQGVETLSHVLRESVNHGCLFMPDQWVSLMKQVFLPLFQPLLRLSVLDKERREVAEEWGEVTMQPLLHDLVTIVRSGTPSSFATFPFILDTCASLILTVSEKVTELGMITICHLVCSLGSKMEEEQWDLLCNSLTKLFEDTQPKELRMWVQASASRRDELYIAVREKSKFQLLLINLVHEIITSQHFFIPVKYLHILFSLVHKSWHFAERFNCDMEERYRLFSAGFLTAPPSLLKQEISALKSFITGCENIIASSKKGRQACIKHGKKMNGVAAACLESDEQEISALKSFITGCENIIASSKKGRQACIKHVKKMNGVAAACLESDEVWMERKKEYLNIEQELLLPLLCSSLSSFAMRTKKIEEHEKDIHRASPVISLIIDAIGGLSDTIFKDIIGKVLPDISTFVILRGCDDVLTSIQKLLSVRVAKTLNELTKGDETLAKEK